MAWYNWLIVIVPFLFVIGMALYSRRYIRDVVDYLAADLVSGRYEIAVAGMGYARTRADPPNGIFGNVLQHCTIWR